MCLKKKKGILPRQVMGRINVSEVFELKDIISHGSVFFYYVFDQTIFIINVILRVQISLLAM